MSWKLSVEQNWTHKFGLEAGLWNSQGVGLIKKHTGLQNEIAEDGKIIDRVMDFTRTRVRQTNAIFFNSKTQHRKTWYTITKEKIFLKVNNACLLIWVYRLIMLCNLPQNISLSFCHKSNLKVLFGAETTMVTIEDSLDLLLLFVYFTMYSLC